MNSLNREPIIDPSQPAQVLLLDHWHDAKRDRDFHFARAGVHGNIEASFAAHKMSWLKHLLRDLQELSIAPL